MLVAVLMEYMLNQVENPYADPNTVQGMVTGGNSFVVPSGVHRTGQMILVGSEPSVEVTNLSVDDYKLAIWRMDMQALQNAGQLPS